MYCNECGTSNDDKAKFCKACGKSFGVSGTAPDETPIFERVKSDIPEYPVVHIEEKRVYPKKTVKRLSSDPATDTVKRLFASPIFLGSAIVYSAALLFSILSFFTMTHYIKVFAMRIYNMFWALSDLPFDEELFGVIQVIVVVLALINIFSHSTTAIGLWYAHFNGKARFDGMNQTGISVLLVSLRIQQCVTIVTSVAVTLVLLKKAILPGEIYTELYGKYLGESDNYPVSAVTSGITVALMVLIGFLIVFAYLRYIRKTVNSFGYVLQRRYYVYEGATGAIVYTALIFCVSLFAMINYSFNAFGCLAYICLILAQLSAGVLISVYMYKTASTE